MIAVISHVSLGLLLGALCGVGMSAQHPKASAWMRLLCAVSALSFVSSALAAHHWAALTRDVTLLADYVMLGVGMSLTLSVLINNMSRLTRRDSAQLPRVRV
jgi:hypothetical protein